jgi:hypothetical protein
MDGQGRLGGCEVWSYVAYDCTFCYLFSIGFSSIRIFYFSITLYDFSTIIWDFYTKIFDVFTTSFDFYWKKLLAYLLSRFFKSALLLLALLLL